MGVEVKGMGDPGGIAVVLDFPTFMEMRQMGEKKPVVGLPLKLIKACLTGYGYTGPVYITCAVKTQYLLGKHPAMDTVKESRISLMDELETMDIKKVLVCGSTSHTICYPDTKPFLPAYKFRGRGRYINVKGRDIYSVATHNPYSLLRTIDFYRDFALDMYKFLNSETVLPPPRVDVVVIKTLKEAVAAYTNMLHSPMLSLDLETTGFNCVQDDVISIGFYDGFYAYIFGIEYCESSFGRKILDEFFRKFRGRFVLHNAKFDLKFLTVYLGHSLTKLKIADTLLMHYVLDERPIGGFSGHGLKDLARVYFDDLGYAISFDEFYSPPKWERDYETLYNYQALDCFFTYSLYPIFLTDIQEEFGGIPFFMENLLFEGTKVFTDMEVRGVLTNKTHLAEQQILYEKMSAEADEEVKQYLERPKFNCGSPKQVSDLIWKEWGLKSEKSMGGGVASHSKKVDLLAKAKKLLPTLAGEQAEEKLPGTAREMMLQMSVDIGGERGHIIKRITDARFYKKIAKTYFKGLVDKVDPDSCIRTDIRLAGTATGRLSSSKPNLQNIPNLLGPAVRNALVPREGYVFLQMDYSQLELRIVGLLARDTRMAESYKNHVDLHRLVGAEMFQKPPEEVTYLERYLAKRVDFGILYGRSAQAIVEGGEQDLLVEQGGQRLTVKEAQEFIDRFLGGFPDLRDWMVQQKMDVMSRHYTQTAFGRKRRFQFITREMVGSIGRQSVNTPVQGLASDVCLWALIQISKKVQDEKLDIYPLFSVHDSILFEVQEDLVEQAYNLIIPIMEHPPLDDFMPFEADCEAGYWWGELTKWKPGIPLPEKVLTGVSH